MRLPALERGRAQSLSVRAITIAVMCSTPAARKVAAMALSVAPVVITSSTTITRLPVSCGEMFGSTMNALRRLFKR